MGWWGGGGGNLSPPSHSSHDGISMRIDTHLEDRFIRIDLHRPVLDYKNNVATFYIWNISGELLGYQKYNPLGDKKNKNSDSTGRYYSYGKKIKSTVFVWGIESLYQSDGAIFITEGIFDAARMTYVGKSALAMLSNDPPKSYWNFLSMMNRPIVAICDNDDAGKKLSKFANYTEIVTVSKDLGSAPESYIQQISCKYI